MESKIYYNNIKNIILSNSDIEGDIIELGVYKGQNTFIIGDILKKYNINKKYYGLDTFTGYTINDINNAKSEKEKNGLIRNQLSNRWKVDEKKILKELKNKNLDNICHIIKGDICETVYDLNINKISILYIDCNAYLPAFTALKALYNKLQDSCLIIVDEHRIGGETSSLREFIKQFNVKGNIFSLNTNYKTGPRIIFLMDKNNGSNSFNKINDILNSKYTKVNKLS